MTSSGLAYARPTLGQLIKETDGSESPLLPTPLATEGTKGSPNNHGSRGDLILSSTVTNLLPTPTARDWKSGASNLHGKNARPLNETILLLKTPTANLGGNGAPQHPEKRRGGGMVQPSMTRCPTYFPTPTAADGTGGPGESQKRQGGMNLRTAVTRLPNGGANICP